MVIIPKKITKIGVVWELVILILSKGPFESKKERAIADLSQQIWERSRLDCQQQTHLVVRELRECGWVELTPGTRRSSTRRIALTDEADPTVIADIKSREDEIIEAAHSLR